MNQSSQSPMQSIRMFRSRGKNKKRPRKIIDSNQYSHEVYQKFLKILNKRRESFLKDHLTEYYGKNFPINYKEHYLFQQQWQNKLSHEQKGGDNYFNQISTYQTVISITTIIIYFFTIWLTHVDLFFREDGKVVFYYQVYSLALVIIFINILRKIKNQNLENEKYGWFFEFLKKEYLKGIVILYFILKLFGIKSSVNAAWILFESLMLLILYLQASKRYQSLRLNSFSLQYEYQTKVVDMIVTIFIMAHLISILLYGTTKLNPQNNWLTNLNFDKNDEYMLYLHSFYFCTTTIMTVGYGDITPKNPTQVLVVIFVQIFGIVMLGYIINQIGYCISSLRKDREVIQKDLSILQKLKKHYRMNANLTQKVRAYIVNSKPNINQLSPEEQKGIFIKLNEEIRADLLKQNMVSIVKSSVFFLCRWTHQFQNSVASRLTHILFNPNDILYQPSGNERIYIIKSGKIKIHVGRIGKQILHNVLKTISNTIENEVSDNCYGYSAVISIRPVKLYAISKDFTSCYYLDKQKFMECVNEKIPDYEYYHELKSKIDQATHCESIEIQRLQSSKHHYNPTKSLLLKKLQKSESFLQERENYTRSSNSSWRGTKHIYSDEAMKQIRNNFCGSYASLRDTVLLEDSISERREKTSTSHNQNEDLFKLSNQSENVSNFDHQFESSKEYSNYFSRNNKTEILRRLETEYFMPNYEAALAKYRENNFFEFKSLY